MGRFQHLGRHRLTGIFYHTQRRCVDQPVRRGDRCREVQTRHRSTRPKPGTQAIRQISRSGSIGIDQRQLPDTKPQRGVGHGAACPAGTELHHPIQPHIRQPTPERGGETRCIGVVADPLAVLQHHGVHGADCTGVVGDFMQQRQHQLLARMCDVQPVEAHTLRRRQQVRQRFHAQRQRRQVDQPIQIAQTQRFTFLHMHGRRQ